MPLRFHWSVLAAGLLVAPGPASAADAPSAKFSDTIEQRLEACAACHGKQGEGTGAKEYYPRIGGKPAHYLYLQLVNFREGRRNYPQMVYLMRYMSDEYLAEIAEYYARQRPPFSTPITPVATSAELARGEALATKGDTARNIPACAACHGDALTGMQPAIPGLVGLHPDYLAAQLGAWRTNARVASPPDCMHDIALRLTGADVNAVAKWLASRPGTPATLPAPETARKLPLACGSQTK